MIMFPTHSLSKKHPRRGYVGGYSDYFGLMSRLDCCSEAFLASSDHHHHQLVGPMAEDESRTESCVNETGSSSKDGQDDQTDHGGWLRLGIGGSGCSDQAGPTTQRTGFVELDLLATRNSHQARSLPIPPVFSVPEVRAPRPFTNMTSATNCSSSLLLQHPGTSSMFPQHQDINWAFMPVPRNRMVASTSSSSSYSFMPPGSYFTRPFQLHGAGVDVAGPSLDFRIIDPPRRPHSGIWFLLQASQNQARQPFLPQIPKSYLRIKDGRMTVGLLMKYLVMKLTLSSESEIEITCRGQQLEPFLTLQHVRDSIWSTRDAVTLLQDASASATDDHVMVLHYARSRTAE
ncbi:E3 ubiquitin protein like [Actinidia chinensis var. chinensis]|uniref:E3 ubiquitin protein like n=1 Tax=Actinidia chinensis var. chinensis TaxID=1590841 RepID=A0A2R6REM2_ACTCC|nr:E3 ubiquitin protein like [Actinidia chinensis var. chinensis]